MDPKLIERICKQVYKKYPEVDGAAPALSDRPENQILLVFKGSATTADGHTLQRVVRVVVDGTGKILKSSVSR